MPDVVTHWYMGEQVLLNLPEQLVLPIDKNAFQLGLIGPDPYIYYRFFAPHFRKGINLRSKEMHTEKTGIFLYELAKKANDNQAFSYLIGFLCHYSLDSISHPYILKEANGRKYMHMAIEHGLDVAILQKKGNKTKDIKNMFPMFLNMTKHANAVEIVYGWSDKAFQISYKHMKLWYIIVGDRYGILNAVVRKIKPDLACVFYSNAFYQKLNLEKYENLIHEAVNDAVRLITKTQQYIERTINEEDYIKEIGNRSYYGDEEYKDT